MTLAIQITLLSDATFGRGDGISGLVDEEVEHDPMTGLPYLRGRALKGLLVEECANLLYALEQGGVNTTPWHARAARLFGQAGSTPHDDARMRVGDAELPEPLRRAILADVQADPPRLTTADVLESLTAIRRQTAVNAGGAPEEGSLRAMRVLLRDTTLAAPLTFDDDDLEKDADALALLAACVLSLRRGGTGRNRGRGRLRARLADADRDVTDTHFAHFQQAIQRGAP